MATCAAIWQGFVWSRPLWAEQLEGSEDVIRILGVLVFSLLLSYVTLSAQPAQAGVANPELSHSYQSEEGEKKQDGEDDEEPECE
jgi:hypothetical protein